MDSLREARPCHSLWQWLQSKKVPWMDSLREAGPCSTLLRMIQWKRASWMDSLREARPCHSLWQLSLALRRCCPMVPTSSVGLLVTMPAGIKDP